ncbi:MAG: M23 family metallopeptidase [Steroidobacteraceae bacterium]
MNLVLFVRRQGQARNLHLSHRLFIGGAAGVLLVMLGMAFVAGLQLGERSGLRTVRDRPAEWARTVGEQQAQITELRAQLQERVDALAARVGQVNAHIVRLDALGKRLTQMADIDDREFNFDSAPATGGPESDGIAAQVPDLSRMLGDLEQKVSLRGAQLSALENVILQRELRAQTLPDGRPVRNGFISSYFGDRADPFDGHEAFHKGLDFAGTLGADVISVGAGVVTFVGDRSGYGHVVEVTHGDGYTTLYAHNAENLVELGQTVARGQTLAHMGSTGRSTGPHVHFEVQRGGRAVNPVTYIGN